MDFAYFYSAKRGDKFFELSNHLVNVLSVVSDRKLPVENGWVRKYGASLQKQTSGQEIEEIIKSDFQLLVSDPGSYFANKLTEVDPILGSLIRAMTTTETIQKVGEGDPEAIATIT